MNCIWLSRRCSLALLASLLFAGVSPAHAEWNFGFGSGLFNLNVEGDQGINTRIAGPVVLPVDLDPDDISDLMESALGVGGYATNGPWLIQYSLANLALEGQASGAIGTTPVSARIGFDVTGADVSFGYALTKDSPVSVRLLAGLRYINHELTGDLQVGANAISRGVDLDWTDYLVGVQVDVPFNEKWSWGLRLDANEGDTEGGSLVNTGVTWRFVDRWTATVFVQNQALELVNGAPGDTDFYLYDADEFGWGLTFLHHW